MQGLKKLKTFKEFKKEIPEDIHLLIFKRYDGSLIQESTIEEALFFYAEQKVLNFYNRKNGKMEVFLFGE